MGKFYPFHNGHKYLIERALAESDELTIVVCDKEQQRISGEERAKWIREEVPRAKVIIAPDFLPDDDSAGWAGYIKWLLHEPPDVVFTSEDYGELFSKFLGCRHISVDKERRTIPVSGTKIRKNPLENWEHLPPAVRGRFAKRICILGAESTGTTTLAEDLAKNYQTVWVQEFGRMYSESKLKLHSQTWRTEEFVFIAEMQNRMEDELAKVCNKILICDTDSFATTLWHERYMGFVSSAVDALSVGRDYSLYILTGDEISFVQDGTRDGEYIRHAMHKRFEEELARRGKKYITVRGSREERMRAAIAACDEILEEIEAF